MANRTRWQPPYPDPTKAYRIHQNAEKLTDRLDKNLRKHIRCMVHGCTEPADERATRGNVNICLRHLQKAAAQFPNTLICGTCATFAADEERARAAGFKASRVPSDGTIYYVQIADEIKIGWTSNLTQRMRAYPPSAKLLATEPGTKAIERARHQLFNEYLSHGREWFTSGRFLLEHIDQLVEKYGDPPSIETLSTPKSATMPSTLKAHGTAHKRREHDGSAAMKRVA